MTEIHTRRIKAIAGSGTGSVKVVPPTNKRIHGLGFTLTWASGVSTAGDTLAEQLAAVTSIRAYGGTTKRWDISGVRLRDLCLLHGTVQDFDAVSTYVAQIYLPLAPDWYIANVSDSLAWNPAKMGQITVELDIAALNTSYYPAVTGYARVSDDLDAPSSGIITLETITPVAGGTSFYIEKELAPRGRLVEAAFYPATGTGTYPVQAASLLVGRDETPVYEDIMDEETADIVGRASDTPTASGRSSSIYDMVFVRGDALANSINLAAYGQAKFQVRNTDGNAFVGTVPTVLTRLEQV